MQVFEYTDFSQNLSKVFDIALNDEVIIKNKDGNNYKLAPIAQTKSANEPLKEESPFVSSTEGSPLDEVTPIKLNVTTQEIVEMIRESRAGI
jgi:hypothetical protein